MGVNLIKFSTWNRQQRNKFCKHPVVSGGHCQNTHGDLSCNSNIFTVSLALLIGEQTVISVIKYVEFILEVLFWSLLNNVGK